MTLNSALKGPFLRAVQDTSLRKRTHCFLLMNFCRSHTERRTSQPETHSTESQKHGEGEWNQVAGRAREWIRENC